MEPLSRLRTTLTLSNSGRRNFIKFSAGTFALWLAERAFAQSKADISGAYYDWQQTMRPESPWLHDYSQTWQTGIFLCQRDGSGQVKKIYHTFEDALDVIRKIDNVSLGMPKIVILAGWQYNGHDSRYPSWGEANESLKRPQDKTALDSLRWLMTAAREYHTIVTLHINMFDAYKDSPLWSLYERSDIILKDKQGVPIEGPTYDGMQSYQISYAQEWKLGYAQKRIDDLIRMVPELKEAGVIHIDAFKSRQGTRLSDPLSSPCLGYTIEDEMAAQRKILRYWRAQGIDVTTEYATNTIDPDPFIGLQAAPNCIDMADLVEYDWLHKPANFLGLPASLYPALPCDEADDTTGDPLEVRFDQVLKTFCTKALPWYYHNNTALKENGFIVPRDYLSDIFIPALWRFRTIVAYSLYGDWDMRQWEKLPARRIWHLPPSWNQFSNVKVSAITPEGLGAPLPVPVTGGAIDLELKRGEAVAIEPA